MFQDLFRSTHLNLLFCMDRFWYGYSMQSYEENKRLSFFHNWNKSYCNSCTKALYFLCFWGTSCRENLAAFWISHMNSIHPINYCYNPLVIKHYKFSNIGTSFSLLFSHQNFNGSCYRHIRSRRRSRNFWSKQQRCGNKWNF